MHSVAGGLCPGLEGPMAWCLTGAGEATARDVVPLPGGVCVGQRYKFRMVAR